MNKTMKDMKQLMYAALLLFASCSQEGNNLPDTGDCVPLTVTSVSVASGAVEPNTRALPVSVTEGKLWVAVRARNGYTAQTGLVYTGAAGKWTCPTFVKLLKDPISLYAYYPQDGYSIDGSGNVGLTTQPYATAKDLGYALSGGENVCLAHPYAGFVLKHAYARLRVEISFSPDIDDTSLLDSVTVAATGLLNDGRQNVENGTFTPGGSATALKWKPGVALYTLPGSSSMGYKFTGDILVVPSASLSNARFSLSLQGSNYIADISAALVSLEAGRQYRLRAVMGTSLIIDGIDKETWNEFTPQNGDSHYETGIPPVLGDNTLIDQWTNGSSASGDTQLP